MKKQSILNLLAQIKAENEQKSGEECEDTPRQLVGLLLDYINDKQIREAVDAICF